MSFRTLAFVAAAALAATPLAAQTTIGAGETVTGTLGEGDRRHVDGEYYDAYVLRGRPGETLIIQMASDDFDTVLYWGTGSGDDWEEEMLGDDWGEGTNSRLVVRLDGAGEHELRAAAFEEGLEGAYELRVMAVGAAPAATPLRLGQTIEGRLDESDYAGEDGYQDHYSIEGRDGDTLTLYLQSDGFDTFITFGPWSDGAFVLPVSDDDGGQGTNSELVAEFGDGDVYRIVVRSFSGEQTGDYTLRVVAGSHPEGWDDGNGEAGSDGDPPLAPMPDDEVATDTVSADLDGTGSVVRVAAGEALNGWIGEGARDLDGGFYQDFAYTASAGERLQVHVSSDEMDPFVLIGTGLAHDFEPLADDDDSGTGLDAELLWTVEEAGEYTIRVTSATPGQTGLFSLRVHSAP
jgi:hypothetical protein